MTDNGATWSIGTVAERLDRSEEAIRSWGREYGELLSDAATPPKGRDRLYTPRDFAILESVRKRIDAGMNHDEIRPILAKEAEQGQFDGIDDFPPEDIPSGVIPIADHNAEIVRLEQAAHRLKELYDDEKEARIAAEKEAAKLEGQIEELRKQLAAVDQKELMRMSNRITLLEYQLEQAQRKLKEGD